MLARKKQSNQRNNMSQSHSEEENIDGIIKEILSVPSITAARFNRDEKLEEATQVMVNMSSKRRIKFIDQVVKETATKIGSMYIPIIIIAGCPGTSESQAAMCINGQAENDNPEHQQETALSCMESFLHTILALYFKSGGKLKDVFEVVQQSAEEEL